MAICIDTNGFLCYNICITREIARCVHEWHSPISATKGSESNTLLLGSDPFFHGAKIKPTAVYNRGRILCLDRCFAMISVKDLLENGERQNEKTDLYLEKV